MLGLQLTLGRVGFGAGGDFGFGLRKICLGIRVVKRGVWVNSVGLGLGVWVEEI